MDAIRNFEMCVKCSQNRDLTVDHLLPMVFIEDRRVMRCDLCKSEYRLPDSESLIEKIKGEQV